MFAATATDEDKDPLTFTWTFSDGSSLTGPNVQHIFAANGTYNVQLSVTDGKAPVSKSQSVTVNSDMCGSFTELKALFTLKLLNSRLNFQMFHQVILKVMNGISVMKKSLLKRIQHMFIRLKEHTPFHLLLLARTVLSLKPIRIR